MIDVLSKVSAIAGIFEGPTKKTPNDKMQDGPIMGNGDLGVAVSARDTTLRFYMGKNDFWYPTLESMGGGMKPVGYLRVTIDGLWDGVDFQARQEILHGEVIYTIPFVNTGGQEQLLKIRSYVLRQHNILVTEISCEKGSSKLKLDLAHVEDISAEMTHKVYGNEVHISKIYRPGEYNSWGSEVYGILKILGHDSNQVRLNEGEKVTLITAVATNHETPEYEAAVKKMVQQDFEQTLPVLWAEHVKWWEEFWQTSGVSLEDYPEVEKMWYASHYVMACCSSADKMPPGSFGNWITVENPAWCGDYHLNYNYEAPWWGSYSSNKIELTGCYDKPLLEYMPMAQQNAREFLNCRGLYAVVSIGPKGTEACVSMRKDGSLAKETSFWGQKSNASYAAVNMSMRFYTTYDAEYARTCAYPFMREVALFWEDYLKFEDGRYVIYNDCIHENVAAGLGVYDWVKPEFGDYKDDFNPILSLGLIRMVFKTLLDMREYLQIEEPEAEKWQHILDHISEFPTQIRDGEKVFRYTERGMDWNPGNTLGIQHVYPCSTIGLASEPELLQIARDTLRVMSRWSDYNGFSTFYTAAARLGHDPAEILENMKEQIAGFTFPNFAFFYGGGGIENSGAVPNCVNEMLFQSHEGILRFFPVWDHTKNAEFEHLRGYGAFIVSAKLQDGQIGPISLYSEKGRDCKVQCPWEQGMVILNGEKQVDCTLEECNGQRIYSFATEPGEKYILCQA